MWVLGGKMDGKKDFQFVTSHVKVLWKNFFGSVPFLHRSGVTVIEIKKKKWNYKTLIVNSKAISTLGFDKHWIILIL